MGVVRVLWDTIDMADALHPQTLLACGMNGEALPLDHGARFVFGSGVTLAIRIRNISRKSSSRTAPTFTAKAPARGTAAFEAVSPSTAHSSFATVWPGK